jgi:hypothetical protein
VLALLVQRQRVQQLRVQQVQQQQVQQLLERQQLVPVVESEQQQPVRLRHR